MNIHLVRPLSQVTPPIMLVMAAAPALYTMVGRMTNSQAELAKLANWLSIVSVFVDVGNALKDKNLLNDFKVICDVTIMTPEVIEENRGPRVRLFANAPMGATAYSTTVRLRRLGFMEMAVEVEEAPETDIVTQIGAINLQPPIEHAAHP